jgi:hypothetical protein
VQASAVAGVGQCSHDVARGAMCVMTRGREWRTAPWRAWQVLAKWSEQALECEIGNGREPGRQDVARGTSMDSRAGRPLCDAGESTLVVACGRPARRFHAGRGVAHKGE